MTKNMTEGNPLKIILLFSVPVLLGNLFQQFYNMVDTIIVGRYLGEEALAAVGSTGCLMFLVLGFANGIAQGFGVMISHCYGAKDYKLLKHYVALSIILTIIVSTILTSVTIVASRQLLLWMNTPDNIFELANDYITVIYGGIILTMSYNVAAGILRGIGDSKTPLFFLILSSFLNIFLDIVLIVIIPLGTAGAAYDTIISQGVSAVLCFIYMFRKFDILKIKREDIYVDRVSVIKLLSIGVPMALNYSVTAVGTIIYQGAMNVFGSSVIAAFTAGAKVFNTTTQTMPAIGTAMATFCGQNLGAGKYDRIFKGMHYAFFLCIATAALGAFLSMAGGQMVIGWFISDPTPEIFAYAMEYLFILSMYYLPLAWIFVYRNALQSLNEGFIPMLSGAVELICRVAVVALFAEPFGFTGICYADPVAWTVTGVLLLVTYLHWKKKIQKKLGVITNNSTVQ